MAKRKRKRKFFIEEKKSVELLKSYGFFVEKKNFFTLRIRPEEFSGFIDWFHTQGTVCINELGQYKGKLKPTGNAEYLAESINNLIYKNN